MIDPVFVWVVSMGMALLFFAAAGHKLVSPSEFRVIVIEYDSLPKAIAGLVASLIPLLEIGLALLWLTQLAPIVATSVSIVLLSVYCIAIGINLQRGRVHISCGCGFSGSGSDSEQPLSVGLIVRNCALIAVLGICLLPQATREMGWIDYIAVLFAVCMALLLYASVSQLLKNDATMASWRSTW